MDTRARIDEPTEEAAKEWAANLSDEQKVLLVNVLLNRNGMYELWWYIYHTMGSVDAETAEIAKLSREAKLDSLDKKNGKMLLEHLLAGAKRESLRPLPLSIECAENGTARKNGAAASARENDMDYDQTVKLYISGNPLVTLSVWQKYKVAIGRVFHVEQAGEEIVLHAMPDLVDSREALVSLVHVICDRIAFFEIYEPPEIPLSWPETEHVIRTNRPSRKRARIQ